MFRTEIELTPDRTETLKAGYKQSASIKSLKRDSRAFQLI